MRKLKTKSISAVAASIALLLQMIPEIPASAEILTNDRYVYEFLTDELCLPHASASGLMANIDQECAFVPTASCVDTNGQISYGLMQWNGPRFEQLKAFCEANGYGYDTLEGQLAFLQYDLTGPYSGYYDYLLYSVEDSAQGAYDAAYFWAARYEVCSPSYFEPRAALAEDYYYPAYLEYAPAVITVFEDTFYASLCGTGGGMALTDDGKALKMQTNTGSSNQVWKFMRQEAYYRIVNCATGRQLTLNENTDALWAFYETASGYMLKLSGTEEVLGCGSENSVQLQISGGSDRQSFQIASVQPAAAAKLKVQSTAAPSVTSFSWNAAEHADFYRLKIYNGSNTKGTLCTAADNLKELKHEEILPSGTYTAVVESINECGAFPSEPIMFTVGQQSPVDLGDTFYAKISWNNGLQYLTCAEKMPEETDAENESVNTDAASEETASAVHSQTATYAEDQLWQFVRNEDGSYRIYSDKMDGILSVEKEKNTVIVEETPDSEKNWIIYGDAEKGYILQIAEKKTEVLSAAEYSAFETAEYTERTGQRFEIADYALMQPEVETDASGGAREPVRFTWNPADCVTGYTLDVKDETGLVAAALQIQGSTTEAELPLEAGSYSAAVSATSSVTGETVISEYVSFSVKNLPERPVVGIDVGQESIAASIYWNRCQDASTYSYKICDAETGEIVIQKDSVKGFGDKINLKSGSYTVTVTAKNAEGSIESKKTSLIIRENSEGAPEVSMKSVLAAKKNFSRAEKK